jgi:hypothetical protein
MINFLHNLSFCELKMPMFCHFLRKYFKDHNIDPQVLMSEVTLPNMSANDAVTVLQLHLDVAGLETPDMVSLMGCLHETRVSDKIQLSRHEFYFGQHKICRTAKNEALQLLSSDKICVVRQNFDVSFKK